MNDPSAERPSPTLGDLRTSVEAEAAAVVGTDRPVESGQSEAGVEARLDSPHAPQRFSTPHGPGISPGVPALLHGEDENAEAALCDEEWELTATDTASLPERWRRHARELAQYLRQRQRDLDEREARMNADAAKLEHEDRLLRLLWSQRLAEWEENRLELARREAELDQRESKLRRREEELEEQATAHRLREEVLDQREYQIGLGEFDLARRRKEWESRVRAFEEHSRDLDALAAVLVPAEEPSPIVAGALPEPDRGPNGEEACEATPVAPAADPGFLSASSPVPSDAGEELRRRARSLAEAEAQANHLRHRAEDLLHGLEQDCDKLRQESRDLRNRWATLERQLLADWTTRNRVLLEREQELRTAAAKNQATLAAAQSLHRRALEHRAAAEELLARLSGRASQVLLRKRLSQLRKELKAAYQDQVDAAEQKLAECRRIREETSALQEALATEWRRHDAALTARRNELLDQARQLTRREEELRSAERDRLLERRKYETVELRLLTEIHRLRERLRKTCDQT